MSAKNPNYGILAPERPFNFFAFAVLDFSSRLDILVYSIHGHFGSEAGCLSLLTLTSGKQ